MHADLARDRVESLHVIPLRRQILRETRT